MHKTLIFLPEVTEVISINSQFLANCLSVDNTCQYLSTLLIKIEQDKPKEKYFHLTITDHLMQQFLDNRVPEKLLKIAYTYISHFSVSHQKIK